MLIRRIESSVKAMSVLCCVETQTWHASCRHRLCAVAVPEGWVLLLLSFHRHGNRTCRDTTRGRAQAMSDILIGQMWGGEGMLQMEEMRTRVLRAGRAAAARGSRRGSRLRRRGPRGRHRS